MVTVAYLLTIVSFPIRSIGWLLGEFPRSVVGFRPGQRRARGDRRDAVRRPRGRRRDGGGARLERRPAWPTPTTPDQPLLDDVTFAVEPGRTVALVGATASGKSTLTTLLTRLVDPDGGAVLLDGTDLRDLARGELAAVGGRGRARPRSSSTTPSAATSRSAPTSPTSEVWAALRTAQADGFVAALPDGLDTQLGERGTSLSGGQRQRISLARALVRRPRLLILDDATSAVDPEVEARILGALRGGEHRRRPWSSSPTARPPSALADEVVHLEDGRIADRGTHAELLARSPAYAHLVNAYEQHAEVDAA